MVFLQGETERFDWPLLQNGAINLYRGMELYDSAIESLSELKYYIIRVRFETLDKFTNDVSDALKWKKQFGYSPWTGNLNGLNDGLSGEPFESANDSAICIENFDALVRADESLSNALLEMVERHSRNYLLFGKRLIGMIQTNDSDYQCSNIGGASANWNGAEWLNENREM